MYDLQNVCGVKLQAVLSKVEYNNKWVWSTREGCIYLYKGFSTIRIPRELILEKDDAWLAATLEDIFTNSYLVQQIVEKLELIKYSKNIRGLKCTPKTN